MVRLNKQIRIEIVENAIRAAGTHHDRESLRVLRASWAEHVRVAALGGHGVDQKVKAAAYRIGEELSKLPKNVVSDPAPLYSDTYLRLSVSGKRVRAYFGGQTSYHTGQPKRFTVPEYTVLAGPLCDEFDRLVGVESDIDARELKIQTEVWAILKSVSSVKRLLEVWPEALSLIPAPSAPAANLPALPVAELNTLLGLGA